MYCAIIGDLVRSKKIPATQQNAVQQKLRCALQEINLRFASSIAAKFLLTLGDEFQGLLHKSACSPPIITWLLGQLHPQKIRFGVGIGDMFTTIDPEKAIGASGPAFTLARKAIVAQKQSETTVRTAAAEPPFSFLVRYETDAPDAALLNVGCRAAHGIVSGWTQKQWETVKAVTESGSQNKAAACLGLADSTVSRNLQAARYEEYRAMLAQLQAYLKDTYDTR